MIVSDWLILIEKTQAEEISCTDCLDQSPALVEAELTGGAPMQPFAGIRAHLLQCKACREEYEILFTLAEAENHGKPPAIAEILARWR